MAAQVSASTPSSLATAFQECACVCTLAFSNGQCCALRSCNVLLALWLCRSTGREFELKKRVYIVKLSYCFANIIVCCSTLPLHSSRLVMTRLLAPRVTKFRPADKLTLQKFQNFYSGGNLCIIFWVMTSCMKVSQMKSLNIFYLVIYWTQKVHSDFIFRCRLLIHDSYPDVLLFHSLLCGDFPSRWLQLLQWPLVSPPVCLTRSRRFCYRTNAVHELPSPLVHLL